MGQDFDFERRILVAKKLLRDTNPELRSQFHETLNVGVAFDDLFVIFDSKVYWTCPSGHLIFQKPRGRSQGKCPACSLDGSRNYLGDVNLALVDEFDPDGNGDINPKKLFSRSPGTYSWTCTKTENTHTYQATVRARLSGHGCPYCAGMKILEGYNDWMTLAPLDNLIWLADKNVDQNGVPINPATLGLDKRTLFYWRCVTGNHERRISISSAVQGQRLGKDCRICSGYKVQPGVSDAFSIYPEMRDQLHPTLNEGLDLSGLHPGNRDVEIFWICHEGHIRSRPFAEELRSKGCGKCSGKELWIGHNDLQSQFPAIATEIAFDLNAHQPGFVSSSAEMIHKHSGADSWWRCAAHGHTWRTKIEKRTREGTGCPFCSDRRVWPGFNDLWSRRPDLVSEIDFEKHPGLDPKELLWVSHDTLNWICSENHRWVTKVHLRSANSNRNPTGCPSCAVSGFKPEQPGQIYFITEPQLKAFKVGITNIGTTRLNAWLNSGWSLLRTFDFDQGAEARFVESRFHFWRRHVLEAPDFLTANDVGSLGGWTETFSVEMISSEGAIQKLQEIIDYCTQEQTPK